MSPMDSKNGLIIGNGAIPIFSFGVITDIQYADIADGHSFLGVPRYYRHSLQVLQRAVSYWNSLPQLSFCVNFGDTIDGFCPRSKSASAMLNILKEFDKFTGPAYHALGNHCLYNFPRERLIKMLKFPSLGGRGYYDFSPTSDFRFVVLDAYDISAIGWSEGHPNTLEAMEILRRKNPNEDKNSPEGLVGSERRFLMFNGAVGKDQLDWLDNILHEAVRCKQKVIICSHLPLYPAAASSEALLWNYNEVLGLIHRFNCVKVCFAGHDHKGGYAVDSHGIHHRVLEAALECPPGMNAFGHVDVYPNRLSLWGVDRLSSTDMVFCD